MKTAIVWVVMGKLGLLGEGAFSARIKSIIFWLFEFLFSFRFARRVFYSDPRRVVLDKKVNVVYFSKGDRDNVGDCISPVIFNGIAERYGINPMQPVETVKRVMVVGSIINSARWPVTVWGSGLHDYHSPPPLVHLDIRAVRGPLTHQRLTQHGYICPKVFGDPAILMPLIFPCDNSSKPSDYVVIPHYSKEDGNINDSRFMSTLTSDWKSFIARLCDSKLVISGSLHGIILAEAYGIPAILLNALDVDLFKYRDYYEATGRSEFPVAQSVEDALSMRPTEIPDFSSLQNGLLESFPKNLWEGAKD